MLAGDIGSLPGETCHAALRRSIYYRPATLLQHLQDFVTHTVPHTFQVDSYRTVKLIVCNLRHRTLRCLDAGIVGRNNPVYHFPYFLRVRHVTAVSHSLAAFCRQFCSLFRRFLDVSQYSNIARFGKRFGAGKADTHCGAGNESYLSAC